MKMTLVRKVFAKDRTLGELYLEGTGYFCDTLEPHCIDWSKENKVAGKTAIPDGRYKVKVGWSQRRGQSLPGQKYVLFPHCSDIKLLYLRGNVVFALSHGYTEHGITVFQFLIGAHRGSVSHALPRHDALHEDARRDMDILAVSYTHLTLPTICSV